jgi:hypothetical protein
MTSAAAVLSGCGDSTKTATTGTTATTATSTAPNRSTPTTPPKSTPTTPRKPATTPTSPAEPPLPRKLGPTITAKQARKVARHGASLGAARLGIGIGTRDWNAICTAPGGRTRSSVWSCPVSSMDRRCSGTLTAYSKSPGIGATRAVRLTCQR